MLRFFADKLVKLFYLVRGLVFAQEVRLEIDGVDVVVLGELRHHCSCRVHELLMRCDLFVLANRELTLRLKRIVVPLSNRVDDPISLTLIGKLPKGGPVFDISGREDGVAHLRLVLLGLVPIAEAPAGGTDILRVVVGVVLSQHLTELAN